MRPTEPGIGERLKLPTRDEAGIARLWKYGQPTRLDQKTARDKADEKAERVWKIDVFHRDQGKSRYSGVRLKVTMQLDQLRAERHHIVSKADKRVRWDPRNALLLSLAEHERVEHNELRIIGTVFFDVGDRQYIDARFPVWFEDPVTGVRTADALFAAKETP